MHELFGVDVAAGGDAEAVLDDGGRVTWSFSASEPRLTLPRPGTSVSQ